MVYHLPITSLLCPSAAIPCYTHFSDKASWRFCDQQETHGESSDFHPKRKIQWPEINPLGFAKVCQHIPRLKQLPDIGTWCSLHFLIDHLATLGRDDHPRPKQLTVGKGISNEELQKHVLSGELCIFWWVPKNIFGGYNMIQRGKVTTSNKRFTWKKRCQYMDGRKPAAPRSATKHDLKSCQGMLAQEQYRVSHTCASPPGKLVSLTSTEIFMIFWKMGSAKCHVSSIASWHYPAPARGWNMCDWPILHHMTESGTWSWW